MLLGQDFSDLTVMATRDGANETSIHYLFRLLNAGDFVLGKDSQRRVYYSLSVDILNCWVRTGSAVCSDQQQLHDYLDSGGLSRCGSIVRWRSPAGWLRFPGNISCA